VRGAFPAARAAANYRQGVAVFVLQPKGPIVEASIGGKQFNCQASADVME